MSIMDSISGTAVGLGNAGLIFGNPGAGVGAVPTTTVGTGSETLTGFDMVWAITQNTVNSQLSWLSDAGLIPNTVKMGDLDVDGITIDGTIAPPTVNFDTGTPRTAKLTVAFTGGTVTHFTGFGPSATPVSQPLAGWTLVFDVALNIGQLAHETVQNGKVVPPEIQAILTQFDATMFSIQSIFLDFQNSDLTTYDTVASVLNTDDSFLKANFGTAMGAWIGSHKGTDNPFILGYPVTRVQPTDDVKAVLEPTGANLSTHAYEPATPGDSSGTGLSTLNFLLVTDGRDIANTPRLHQGDAGTFHRNLVGSNDIDGRGIVGRNLFFGKYLQDLVIAPFQAKVNELPDYVHARDDRGPNVDVNDKSGVTAGRATFVQTATGWSYGDHVQLSWHESGFNSHDRKSEQNLTFTVSVSQQPDAAGASRLTMDITGGLFRSEADQLNTDIPPFKSNVYVGDGWANATLSWSLRLQFIAGTDGKINITSSKTVSDPVQDSGTGGAYDLANFFTDLFNVHGINDDWSNNSVSLGNVESGIVTDLINQTGPILDNAMTRVVMPARSQFFYKNIQLNADGDVEIDFTYKSQG